MMMRRKCEKEWDLGRYTLFKCIYIYICMCIYMKENIYIYIYIYIIKEYEVGAKRMITNGGYIYIYIYDKDH